jgi:hypothetical protein
MLTIEETTDYQMIHDMASHPILAKVTAYPGDVDTTYRYVAIKDDDIVIGYFNFRSLTCNLAEAHIAINPEFWGTAGLSEAAGEAGFKWLRDNTKFIKCFTDVPLPCVNVHGLCKKLGWEACGMIKNGCIFDGTTTDLVLYDYNLYGVK